MLHQAAMLIIFFAAAVPKDSQRFPEWCASTFFFYAISFQSVNSKACGSFAASLFFYFSLVDTMLNRLYKIEHRALNAVAAAASL